MAPSKRKHCHVQRWGNGLAMESPGASRSSVFPLLTRNVDALDSPVDPERLGLSNIDAHGVFVCVVCVDCDITD